MGLDIKNMIYEIRIIHINLSSRNILAKYPRNIPAIDHLRAEFPPNLVGTLRGWEKLDM